MLVNSFSCILDHHSHLVILLWITSNTFAILSFFGHGYMKLESRERQIHMSHVICSFSAAILLIKMMVLACEMRNCLWVGAGACVWCVCACQLVCVVPVGCVVSTWLVRVRVWCGMCER